MIFEKIKTSHDTLNIISNFIWLNRILKTFNHLNEDWGDRQLAYLIKSSPYQYKKFHIFIY